MLIGKRMRLGVSEGAYWRKFVGEGSPGDLEAGLQLVHKLFTTNIKPPRNEDLKTIIKYAFSDAKFLWSLCTNLQMTHLLARLCNEASKLEALCCMLSKCQGNSELLLA